MGEGKNLRLKPLLAHLGLDKWMVMHVLSSCEAT